MSDITYKSSGVDLDQYQQAMRKLPELLQRTRAAQPGRVMELAGGFAGLFRLTGGGRTYDDPVLVSGTDGVGTKIRVAQMAGVYDTIGVDLVAMCVNDCLCLGAEPLFFLDYLAFGRDNPALIAALVEGVSTGCQLARSALLGGETAIMPGLYAEDDFDMAGFSLGVVERDRIIDGKNIQPGNVLLGLESSGLHSNGFSLVRKVVFEIAGLGIDDPVPGTEKTVGDVLLEPTRIYVDAIAAVVQHASGVHGIAHITGGGLAENIERILPQGRRAKIDRGSWPVPSVFGWLQDLGNIDREEMYRVFNMGIGMAVVVDAAAADDVIRQCSEQDARAFVIGQIVDGEQGAEYVG